MCAVGNATGLSVTANTQHTLPFPQADQWDTNAFHDISTNNTRITIPSGYGGKYLITAQIQNALVANYAYLIFMKNGSNTGAPSGPPGAFYGRIQNNGGNTYGVSSTILLSLAANDYIEVGFQSDQTTTMIYDARFTATYLGA